MPDLDRIAFVTRRFGDLQGLRVAVFGTALVVCFVALSALPADFANPFLHMALPAQIALLGMTPGLDRFYTRAFGRVPTRLSDTFAGTVAPAANPAALGAFVVLLGMMADMFSEFAVSPRVSLGSVALAGYSMWILVRDWPYRIHHAIGAVAGIAGVLITSDVSGVTTAFGDRVDRAVAMHYALAYALAGLGLLAIGLLDHRLLVESMSAGGSHPSQPDPSATRARITVSASVLILLLVYSSWAGWPPDGIGIYMAFFLTLCVLPMLRNLAGLNALRPGQRAAYSELTRAREVRFLAQIQGKGADEEPNTDIDPVVCTVTGPSFDTVGHLALPIAMASGAIVDAITMGSGFPSLFGIAFAGSHLRIATRDARRRYYLIGMVAGIALAMRYMFIDAQQPFDWLLWLLILVCSAMLVEGLLDLRLTSQATDIHTGARHADAI